MKTILAAIKKYHLIDHLVGVAARSVAGGCVLSYIVVFAHVVSALQ